MNRTPTIEDVMTELEELKKRVRELERSNHPLPSPFAPGPTFKLNQCSACGISLEGTMGYVCSNPRCPTMLGPVMS